MTSRTRFPIVTLLLVGANIVTAFVNLLVPEAVEMALWGRWGWLVGLFVHRDLVHLAGNMIFLAAVGPAVEFAAGSVRFLGVYLVGGLAGVALHSLFAGMGGPPLVGASGCVAACLGYYAVRYASMRVPLVPGKGVPFGWIAGLWVVLQAVGGFFQGGGTSYWSHLGGFAAGILASLVFRVPKLAEVTFGHEALEKLNERGPFAVLRASEEFLRRHPDDAEALEQMVNACRTLGDRDRECQTLMKLLDVVPESAVAPLLQRLSELGELAKVPPLRRMVLADRLSADTPAVSNALWVSVAEGDADDSQVPEALYSLAVVDPGGVWLRRLETDFPMHPATQRARSKGLMP